MEATKALPNLFKLARNAFGRVRERILPAANTAPRINTGNLAAYLNYYNEKVAFLSRNLSRGNITVDEWRREMRAQVRNLHMTGAVIGRGGVDNLDAATLRAVDRKVQEQDNYLETWARELETKAAAGDTLDESAISRRAGMYGTSVSSTVYENNIAAIGVPGLPQYPGDGHTQCLTKCRCSLKVDKLRGDGNWNIYWQLGKAEHCDDCVSLSRRWNPLKIRDGIIQ